MRDPLYTSSTVISLWLVLLTELTAQPGASIGG